MTKEVKGITVGTPVVEKVDDLPRVRVYIPKLEDEGGMKTDPYEHVTINDETTLVRRGEYVDVTVPVFLQLRNKFPHI
jgi:hypothetical protein